MWGVCLSVLLYRITRTVICKQQTLVAKVLNHRSKTEALILIPREGSTLLPLGFPVAACPRGQQGAALCGRRVEGMGPPSTVSVDLGSSTGIQQGHIQTTVLGQTSMGEAGCQSWDRTEAHLIWPPKARSKEVGVGTLATELW